MVVEELNALYCVLAFRVLLQDKELALCVHQDVDGVFQLSIFVPEVPKTPRLWRLPRVRITGSFSCGSVPHNLCFLDRDRYLTIRLRVRNF